MAGSYRHQALIEAPIEEVWAVVSDPRTHPDWWPEVLSVVASEQLAEGGEYMRSSKLMPFLDAVDAVWVAERLEHLKEARFRCTLTGTYAHFTLTPAREHTFVQVETGMDPTRARWRVMKLMSSSFFKRWLLEVLDALPGEVKGARARGM